MKLIGAKRVQNYTRLGREDDPLGTVQEIEIWPYYQMVNTSIRIYPGK